MKWLAVDYGDSRTGLDGCDAGERITSPITPQIEEKSMNKVAAAVPEVSELVVGTGEHECYTPEYRALTRDFYLKF